MKLLLLSIAALLRGVTASASLLVLALSLLLFVQWPLRDWLQAYSREANDMGQIVFALYAAVAVTAASLSKSHLAVTRHDNPTGQGGWRSWALFFCVAPWAVFLLWASVPTMLRSTAQWESFSEGLTPGYFILRIALVLLAVLVLAEAVASVLTRRRPPPDSEPP